ATGISSAAAPWSAGHAGDAHCGAHKARPHMENAIAHTGNSARALQNTEKNISPAKNARRLHLHPL
ncbi:hypothetical protein, partial [Xanthomonas graminis]|uniref:hypothetical protein n=1 Tax=Xanthomonas graminis TaxID=3390026 RepID=UPI001C8F23AB